MGLCTRRRLRTFFLIVVILQITTSGLRQIFDFLGPLWALILTNFLNIVYCIFGFFGAFTRRNYYLISYILWSVAWAGWNIFVVCLYIPLTPLEPYKSAILSLGTGGFSWWETRAPGCIPDWASESQLVVTNCSINPKLMECVQGGVQIALAVIGVLCAILLTIYPYEPEEKDTISRGGDSAKVSSLYAISRGNGTIGSHRSSRHHHRASLAGSSAYGLDAKDGGSELPSTVGGTIDDRLRPMTPRKVKRRSARSIQSSKYGAHPAHNILSDSSAGGGRPAVAGPSGTSARSSVRSNGSSRRSAAARNSKRKQQNNFVSPINRLMQQVDSETSHDDPRPSRYLPSAKYPHHRDQGHINPVYLGGPHSPKSTLPPRPPSARSSYSNYHPARIPPVNPNLSPASSNNPNNVFNLNQNVFTNPAFDNTAEYNVSQHSTHTFSQNRYYDEEHYHRSIPPPPNPLLSPRSRLHASSFFTNSETIRARDRDNFRPESRGQNIQGPLSSTMMAYPLAHSPVSQESFPMWGVAKPGHPSPGNHSNPSIYNHGNNRPLSRQPVNSETVI